jgi:hypothetical protein
MSFSLGINLALFIGPSVPFPAPAFLVESLRSVEVTNTDEGRDGFQITFSTGRSGPADLFDHSLLAGPLLSTFNRVIIMLTLGAVPKTLIDGIITNIQLNPSNEPGQSTLIVTGEDVGVMMDMEEKSETYPNQPDPVIVTRIISSYAKYGLIPMVMPPPALDVPLMTDRIPSQHGTDLSYITELARLHGYVFYIEPELPGINTAYWGPLNLTGIPQKALSVDMGPQTNVSSINFQYSALSPTMVDGSVQDRMLNIVLPVKTFASTRPPLSSRPAWLVNQPNVRSSQFRESGLNTIQAFGRAQAETDRSSTNVLVANGEIDSLQYGDILQARKLVGVRGAGNSHDGLYYVKKVTHNIKLGEYKQSFILLREGFGSLTPVIPP